MLPGAMISVPVATFTRVVESASTKAFPLLCPAAW